jgi:hypothetical protein
MEFRLQCRISCGADHVVNNLWPYLLPPIFLRSYVYVCDEKDSDSSNNDEDDELDNDINNNDEMRMMTIMMMVGRGMSGEL